MKKGYFKRALLIASILWLSVNFTLIYVGATEIRALLRSLESLREYEITMLSVEISLQEVVFEKLDQGATLDDPYIQAYLRPVLSQKP